MTSHYRTPDAFRAALQHKQRQRARDAGVPVHRLAQVDLYYRFLARVLRELGEAAVIVKGGVALEMRLQRARATKDIDLRAIGDPEIMYERIRAAGLRELDDFLVFRVEEPTGPDDIAGDGVVYEGRRFRVQAILGNKPYLASFGLDVAFGDPMVGDPDKVTAPDAFAFVGTPPPVIPIYPIGTHLAEKLHAYTLPRPHGRENSRLKDLVDIALVAEEPILQPSPVTVNAATVREALQATFLARGTHALTDHVPPPPEGWRARYPRFRIENELSWASIDHVRDQAARFLEPILQGTATGIWRPTAKIWAP